MKLHNNVNIIKNIENNNTNVNQVFLQLSTSDKAKITIMKSLKNSVLQIIHNYK